MYRLKKLLRSWYGAILEIIQKSLDDLLLAAYCSKNPWLRQFRIGLVYGPRRWFLFLRRGLVFRVFLLEGLSASGGETLRVAYFAEGKGMEYIQHLLFQNGAARREQLDKVKVWQVGKMARNLAKQVDLVVIERNTLLTWQPPDGFWRAGPTWVRMVHDFQPGETWEMVTRRMKSQEMNIRRVLRSGYTFEIGASDADFHFFYERMHQPLISGRHSGYGRVDTEANLYRIFKNGNLIFILDSSGKRVAGGLNLVKGNAIMGVANGLLDGDEELLKTGALSALYYYILKWCNENHIRRFDLGEVRPFENNGLYQYKRRWGFMAIEEIWNTREWIFWAPGLSPAAMRWIEANRFIPIFARSGGSGEAAPIIENDIKETRPDPV